MPKVLIRSVRQPGVTKLVAPAFAEILTKLKLFTREESSPTPPAPEPESKPKRTYRRRDLKAEE